MPGYRAWRFVHPDLDTGAEPPGLGLSPRGAIQMVAGDEAVRQAILILLTTVPGERVMRPTYGCPLHRLIFLPNDDTTAGLAIHYIRRALERWEPRVDILYLDATRHPEAPAELVITLRYRVRESLQEDALTLAFSLTGEEG